MSVEIECYNCGVISGPTPPLRRDSDRSDIFECPSCKTEFKIDIDNYMENRGSDFIKGKETEGFVARTFSASEKGQNKLTDIHLADPKLSKRQRRGVEIGGGLGLGVGIFVLDFGILGIIGCVLLGAFIGSTIVWITKNM